MTERIQNATFSKESIHLNVEKETNRIVEALKRQVQQRFRRKGAVVGISGGIDSSVVLALCVRAFGPEHVLGLLMPEKESSPESVDLANRLAQHYGVKTVLEDLTGALEGFGCYQRRDEAIQRVIPEYKKGWYSKIVLPGNLLETTTLNVFYLVVSDAQGNELRKRIPMTEFFQIMAASNFKQRSRMSMLYYHAELHNFAAIGTANKNEHDLGFFVKHGDGGIDVNPIAHLFKTQIYELADYLDVPQEIRQRTPTTDTYPGGGSQEEFFYRIPFDILDSIWLGFEMKAPSDEIARALSLTTEQVDRVIADIISKQRTTAYLRTQPLSVDD